MIVVLGFDGLDYRRAIKIKSLRQVEYSRVNLALPEGVPAITAIIWGAYITGTYNHGISYPCDQKTARVKVKTIFDYIPNSKPLWIPSLNPHPKYWGYASWLLIQSWKSEEFKRRYIEYTLELFKEQREEFLKELRKGYNLIFAHFNLIDALMHRIGDAVFKYYFLLAKFVDEVKSIISEDDYLIILSDHGHTGTEHDENNAFYSCNHRLGLKNPKVTDFMGIFLALHFK